MLAAPYTTTFPKTKGYIETDCKVSEAFDAAYAPSGQHPPFVACKAIWDTGAMRSTISVETAKKLQLQPVRQAKVFHADGVSIRNVYYINLLLPNHIEVKNVAVTDGNIEDTDVLIGMDIKTLCDFALTSPGNETKFSFMIPSTLDIDFKKSLTNNN
jgi:uncharacterized protein YwlG (UPF0340 family)